MHVVEAARMGADVGTLPPQVLRQMFAHPLTDKGLTSFLADWAKTGQSILDQPLPGQKADKGRKAAAKAKPPKRKAAE